MRYLNCVKSHNALVNRFYAQGATGDVDSFPEFVTLMPLTKCNYRCTMCAEADRESNAMMSPKVLSEIEGILPFVQTLYITGGEPLMYTHIEDLLTMGAKAQCELWMVTNGLLLTESKREMVLRNQVDQIKISIDAATPKTYENIRLGGNFVKVLKNVEALAKLRDANGLRKPAIHFGFVAMRDNIAELGKLAALAANLGVEKISATYMIVHFKELVSQSLYFHQEYSDEQMLKAIEMARRVGVQLDHPPLFSELRAQKLQGLTANRADTFCIEPWRTIFVRYTGDVNLCCGGGGSCGNLETMSFAEVWNHPARKKARETVNSANPLPACRNCATNKQQPCLRSTHIPNPDLIPEALREKDATTAG